MAKDNNGSLKINKSTVVLIVFLLTFVGTVFKAYSYIQKDIIKQVESATTNMATQIDGFKEIAELSYYRMEDGFELEKIVVTQMAILEEIRDDVKDLKRNR